MRVRSHRDAESARKTEIRKLEVVTGIDKQILRLEIAMENPVRMAVQQARIELVGEFLQST